MAKIASYIFNIGGNHITINFFGRLIDYNRTVIIKPQQAKRNRITELLAELIYNILAKNPHLITAPSFTINICFSSIPQLARQFGESQILARLLPDSTRASRVGAAYIQDISFPENGWFFVSRKYLKEYDENMLTVVLRHELTHHSDRSLKIMKLAMERIKFKSMGFDEGAIIKRLFEMFFDLRAEIPSTISEVEHNTLYVYSTIYGIAKKLFNFYLEGKIDFEYLYKKLDSIYHETSRTIGSILFLYYFMTNNNKNWKSPKIVFVERKLLIRKPRILSIDQLNGVFGRIDFQIDFSWINIELEELQGLIGEFNRKITQMGHLGLMQEFEKAMAYFGIEETFFSVKFYANLKNLVYLKARKMESVLENLDKLEPIYE